MRAIAVVLLLVVARECVAQSTGATTPGMPTPTPVLQETEPAVEAEKVSESYFIPALEIIGFDLALNRFNDRFTDPKSFDVTLSSIGRNLTRGWVIDGDEFEINQRLDGGEMFSTNISDARSMAVLRSERFALHRGGIEQRFDGLACRGFR